MKRYGSDSSNAIWLGGSERRTKDGVEQRDPVVWKLESRDRAILSPERIPRGSCPGPSGGPSGLVLRLTRSAPAPSTVALGTSKNTQRNYKWCYEYGNDQTEKQTTALCFGHLCNTGLDHGSTTP